MPSHTVFFTQRRKENARKYFKIRILGSINAQQKRPMLKDTIGIFKFFIGSLSVFLILFGIHWIALLAGIALGILYFAVPKKYLN